MPKPRRRVPGKQPLAASRLRDPPLWDGETLFLTFNHFVLTWRAWCVPSHELWVRCTWRRPWPAKVLIFLQVTETGCLWLKSSCMSGVSLSLPKPACVFFKACSWKWMNKPVLWICRNAFVYPNPHPGFVFYLNYRTTYFHFLSWAFLSYQGIHT